MKQSLSSLKGKIGLEIHVYVPTKEKLFCKCIASRERGLKPNIHICPICTGQPGAKSMLPNNSAVEQGIRIALMLGCMINKRMPWQRKHYNWPDLPKGYQNTLSGEGAVPLGIKGLFEGIKIIEMHLEEDPASWDPSTGCVDYNRSGLPLVEIVTEPDFSTSEEVISWLQKLLHYLAYLKAADTNAGIKVDVNVNIPGKSERVEVKNLNSLTSIEQMLKYEFERQMKEGGKARETRRFNVDTGKTEVMRSKEEAADYRFIRDPDLSDLIIEKEEIKKLKENLPESPTAKLEKLIKKHKLDKTNAAILAQNLDIVVFFEKIAEKIDASFALPWVTVELLRFLNYRGKKIDEVDIKAEHFIGLLDLVRKGKITPLKAKEILNSFYPKSFFPSASEGTISDKDSLDKIIEEILTKQKNAVEDYKSGEKKALDFLMGQIMIATKKRADYKVARAILMKKLS